MRDTLKSHCEFRVNHRWTCTFLTVIMRSNSFPYNEAFIFLWINLFCFHMETRSCGKKYMLFGREKKTIIYSCWRSKLKPNCFYGLPNRCFHFMFDLHAIFGAFCHQSSRINNKSCMEMYAHLMIINRFYAFSSAFAFVNIYHTYLKGETTYEISHL